MKTTDRIADIIRGLLMKTVGNGATEAEAMAAAAKARELLDKHRLDMADVEADPVRTDDVARSRRSAASIAMQLQTAVGLYCDCIAWQSGGQPKFTGRESDILFATWLLDALDSFCARRTLEYAASQPIGRNRTLETMESFKLGLVSRLRERLREATAARPEAERRQAQQANAVALQRQGVNLTKPKAGRRKQIGRSAFDAGRTMGDAATFSRPVNAGGTVYRLAS